jgi:pimeloyl-ACP methyl ester carboxylesterase
VSASTLTRPHAEPGIMAKVVGALGREAAVARLAIGAVALHVVDDNFLQPNPGTSPGDHLASGLVPLAVLAALAVLYQRLRAGARAATAMTLGAIGVTLGVPGAYYLMKDSASGDHYTGLLAIAAGAVLLLSGPVTLWRARRSDGSRKRRYLRRSLAVAAAPVLLVFAVFPVGYSYVYTHTGQTAKTPDLRVPYERVTVTTSDSLNLAASYVPSGNGAAVILFPGATRSDEARMLIRHKYGVLLLDPRGQGRSEGDIVRWAGDRDLLGAVEYLRGRADVDPGRIGGFGFSVGGEILLEAAAKSSGLKAVVSEGAGLRVGEGLEKGDGVSGPERLLWRATSTIMTAATSVFSNHGPPPPIADRIGKIAPRSVFLVYADPGMGGESTRQPGYYAAARGPKALWKVPGAEHTGGIDAQPAEYERRIVGFFDRALLRPTPAG